MLSHTIGLHQWPATSPRECQQRKRRRRAERSGHSHDNDCREAEIGRLLDACRWKMASNHAFSCVAKVYLRPCPYSFADNCAPCDTGMLVHTCMASSRCSAALVRSLVFCEAGRTISPSNRCSLRTLGIMGDRARPRIHRPPLSICGLITNLRTGRTVHMVPICSQHMRSTRFGRTMSPFLSFCMCLAHCYSKIVYLSSCYFI
eukprot:SAG31_NODE_8676_length_1408_cov_1.788388_2_plen_203_part_00